MKGRTEDKFALEKKIQNKIKGYPNYIIDYYYYLNEKTHNTKERYINHVIRFLNFYNNNDINSIDYNMLNSITSTDIQRYIMSLQFKNNKEIAAETKAIIYSSINSFLTFLKKKKIISENPFDNGEIERPKFTDNEIVFLEPEEYSIVKKNIMNGVGSDKAKSRQKEWMYRDLLLFQIPIITGVRVTALSEINIEDIDFESKTIKVIDKNRNNTLYLDNDTFGMLLVWMNNREKLMEGYKDEGYLFISNQRDKLKPVSIRKIVNKYTYNIDKHITPHKLRSTCGTNMYRATKDIYMVADVLNHKSPATSRKYTKISSVDREEAARLLSEKMKCN